MAVGGSDSAQRALQWTLASVIRPHDEIHIVAVKRLISFSTTLTSSPIVPDGSPLVQPGLERSRCACNGDASHFNRVAGSFAGRMWL